MFALSGATLAPAAAVRLAPHALRASVEGLGRLASGARLERPVPLGAGFALAAAGGLALRLLRVSVLGTLQAEQGLSSLFRSPTQSLHNGWPSSSPHNL